MSALSGILLGFNGLIFFNCGYTSTSLQLTNACLTSDSDTGRGQIKARYFSPTGKLMLLSKLSVYK